MKGVSVSSGFAEILGIIVGHLYFFLMYKYPVDFGGRQWISTPSFLYVFPLDFYSVLFSEQSKGSTVTYHDGKMASS